MFLLGKLPVAITRALTTAACYLRKQQSMLEVCIYLLSLDIQCRRHVKASSAEGYVTSVQAVHLESVSSGFDEILSCSLDEIVSCRAALVLSSFSGV